MRVSVAGSPVPFAGGADSADADRLDHPHGLAVLADGSVVIADAGSNRIRLAGQG